MKPIAIITRVSVCNRKLKEELFPDYESIADNMQGGSSTHHDLYSVARDNYQF